MKEFSNGPMDERRREFSNKLMDERRMKEFSNGLLMAAESLIAKDPSADLPDRNEQMSIELLYMILRSYIFNDVVQFNNSFHAVTVILNTGY